LGDSLGKRPPGDGVGDRDLINIATPQFTEEVLRVHPVFCHSVSGRARDSRDRLGFRPIGLGADCGCFGRASLAQPRPIILRYLDLKFPCQITNSLSFNFPSFSERRNSR